MLAGIVTDRIVAGSFRCTETYAPGRSRPSGFADVHFHQQRARRRIDGAGIAHQRAVKHASRILVERQSRRRAGLRGIE